MTDADVRKRCKEIFKAQFGYTSGTVTINEMATYRAAISDGMEIAAKIVDSHAGELTREMCDGCGNEDDVATGAMNDQARDIAKEIRQAAGEVTGE